MGHPDGGFTKRFGDRTALEGVTLEVAAIDVLGWWGVSGLFDRERLARYGS